MSSTDPDAQASSLVESPGSPEQATGAQVETRHDRQPSTPSVHRSAEVSDNGAEFDSDFEAWFMSRGVYAGYDLTTKRWMMMRAVNERSAFDAGVAAGTGSRQGEVDWLRGELSILEAERGSVFYKEQYEIQAHAVVTCMAEVRRLREALQRAAQALGACGCGQDDCAACWGRKALTNE